MVERTLISFASQWQQIERLQHLLYLSSSIVFICGEKGCGKSTLIEQLSNQLPAKTQQAFISLAESPSAQQIRQKIISQLFDNPMFDAEDTLFNSLLLLKDKLHTDLARVIVIDNAQLLPASLLQELADVIKLKSSLTDNEINFILLSDEFKSNQMVKQLSHHDDIAALVFKLSPLDMNEAQQLLSHSLDQVGYAAKIEHQDAVAQQLLHCQGIPEKILLLATKISSDKLDINPSSWLKTRLSSGMLMIVLLMIAGGLIFHFYPSFKNTQIEVELIVESDAILPQQLHSSDLIGVSTSTALSTEALAGKWTNENTEIRDAELSVGEADNAEQVVILESQLHELPGSELVTLPAINKIVIETISRTETALPVAFDTEANNAIEGSDFDTALEIEEHIEKSEMIIDDALQLDTNFEQAEMVSDAAIQLETAADQAEIVFEETLQSTANIDEPIKKTSLHAVQADTPVTEHQAVQPEQQAFAAKVEKIAIFTSAEELLAVDPDYYTLQLAALSSEQSLREFIVEYQLAKKEIYLYPTMRNGKKWFVIIYGQFKNRETALLEVKKLSNSAIKLDSWAKKYASVHQDLQLNE